MQHYYRLVESHKSSIRAVERLLNHLLSHWTMRRQQIFSSQHGLGRSVNPTEPVNQRLPRQLNLFLDMVSRGLPLFLFPGGVHFRAACGKLFLSTRRTWPSHLHLFCLTHRPCRCLSLAVPHVFSSTMSLFVTRCSPRILIDHVVVCHSLFPTYSHRPCHCLSLAVPHVFSSTMSLFVTRCSPRILIDHVVVCHSLFPTYSHRPCRCLSLAVPHVFSSTMSLFVTRCSPRILIDHVVVCHSLFPTYSHRPCHCLSLAVPHESTMCTSSTRRSGCSTRAPCSLIYDGDELSRYG